MTRTTTLGAIAAIAATVGLWFGPAVAFEDQPADGLSGWQAVSPAELAATRARGGDDDDHDDKSAGSAGAIISGNGAIIVKGNGINMIDNGAFAGSTGLSNVILNNGNGAIIQAGIAVTVNVFPGPPPSM